MRRRCRSLGAFEFYSIREHMVLLLTAITKGDTATAAGIWNTLAHNLPAYVWVGSLFLDLDHRNGLSLTEVQMLDYAFKRGDLNTVLALWNPETAAVPPEPWPLGVWKQRDEWITVSESLRKKKAELKALQAKRGQPAPITQTAETEKAIFGPFPVLLDLTGMMDGTRFNQMRQTLSPNDHYIIANQDLRNYDFRGIKLHDMGITNVNLEGADLTGADLCSVTFEDVNLKGALLRNARLLDTTLKGVSLENCFAEETSWTRTNWNSVDARKAVFTRANFRNSMFQQSNFTSADLYNARFDEVKADPTVIMHNVQAERAFFPRAVFSGVSFVEAVLKGANFDHAVLQTTDFREIHGDHAWFENADLTSTSFKDASLRWANFQNAKAANTSFVNIRAWEVNFSGADLTKAAFIDADLTDANLDMANLTGGFFRMTITKGIRHLGDPRGPYYTTASGTKKPVTTLGP